MNRKSTQNRYITPRNVARLILWVSTAIVASILVTRAVVTAQEHIFTHNIKFTPAIDNEISTITLKPTNLSSSYVRILTRLNSTIPTSAASSDNGRSLSIVQFSGSIAWSFKCGTQMIDGSLSSVPILHNNITEIGTIEIFSTNRRHTRCAGKITAESNNIPSFEMTGIQRSPSIHLYFDYSNKFERIAGGAAQLLALVSAIAFGVLNGIPFMIITIITMLALFLELRPSRRDADEQQHKDIQHD